METQLNQTQVQNILNESFDVNFWYFQLGLSTSNQLSINDDKRFSFDFLKAGLEFWESIISKLKHLLCDSSNQQPLKWVSQLLSGDVKDLIIQLIPILITNLSITVSVAIPIVSLILKTGVYKLCAL